MKRSTSLKSCAECPARGDCAFTMGDARPHAEPSTDVVDYGVVNAYKSGEYILHPGSLIAAAPVICRGVAAVFLTTEGGDEFLLQALGPGAIIGLADCFHKRNMFSVNAKAVTDVTIRFVPISQAQSLLRNRAASEAFSHQIGTQLEIAQRASLCIRARSAHIRVAVAIHELSRLLGLKGDRCIAFPQRIPRWFLAAYTALNPETVSRSLTKLQEEGLIVCRKRHLVIASLAGLERVME